MLEFIEKKTDINEDDKASIKLHLYLIKLHDMHDKR